MPEAVSNQFDQPLRLTEGPQLLLDEELIEDRFNLRRVLHKPMKYERNPILVRDQPWEGTTAYRPQVIWDPHMNRYRMWYQCADSNAYHGGEGSPYYIGYAESDDGFNWTKPRLKGKKYGRYEDTNIVYRGNMTDGKGQRSFSIGQAYLDEDADPSERYKLVGLDGRPHPRHPEIINTEVSVVGSPDGIDWRVLGDGPIFDHHSDTSNHIVHDPVRGRWLLYCRPSVFSSGRQFVDGRHHRRRVSVMVSSDFVNWSYPRTVLFGDERDLIDIDHVHVFRYGSHFLMLYAAVDGEVGRFYTRLASSIDGIRWNRFYTRENFVPMGREGDWDEGIIGPSSGPVRSGNLLMFYYLGANIGQGETFAAKTTRRMSGGVFMLPADRFVSQRAENGKGWLLTREFILNGRNLQINLTTAGGLTSDPGRIRVEVLSHPPLGYHADDWVKNEHSTYAFEGFGLDECVPVGGDRIDAPVRWKNANLASLEGKTVYLRFEITNADLFSFTITP